jgi:hypothetical protein
MVPPLHIAISTVCSENLLFWNPVVTESWRSWIYSGCKVRTTMENNTFQVSREENNVTRTHSKYQVRPTMEQEHIPHVKSGQQWRITHSTFHVRTTTEHVSNATNTGIRTHSKYKVRPTMEQNSSCLFLLIMTLRKEFLSQYGSTLSRL